MVRRRGSTPELKVKLVPEPTRGAWSQALVCRRHSLNPDEFSPRKTES